MRTLRRRSRTRARRAGLGASALEHDRRSHDASADAARLARKGDCLNAVLALGVAYGELDVGTGVDKKVLTSARAADRVVFTHCEIRKRP